MSALEATTDPHPPPSTTLPVLNKEKSRGSSDDHLDKEKGLASTFVELAQDDAVIEDERQLVTQVISLEDDESASPWTLRAFILGIGLSCFGGVLAEIYYFKPQVVLVSTLFLAVIGYVFGTFMEYAVPTHISIPGVGKIVSLHWLNPGPFNKKELAFTLIMASSAATSALATENLAVQRLFYNTTPNPASSIFLLFSSQLLGYGIAGMMRPILLYPTRMLYPGVLPVAAMFDTLYRDVTESSKRLRVFYITFFAIFLWELLPEYLFPLLTGFSIFCLANQNSADFTRIFGGSNGDEGLGLLSICLDWQFISGLFNPLTIPFKAQFSSFLGYLLCMILFSGVFYSNIWGSRSLPFLAQDLFYPNGSVYDQTLILRDNIVDKTLLAEQGLPYYAGSWVVYLLTSNLGLAATFTHLLLWNRDDIRPAWSWCTLAGVNAMWQNFNWRFWQDSGDREAELAAAEGNEELDPHYRMMLKYKDVPTSWYSVTFLLSVIVALVVIYKVDSTLPWWGFLISVLIGVISTLFFGALFAMTGFQFIIQPFMQMIGGFLHPGKPVANMFFVLYSYNSVTQALLLLKDLKLAQYVKLPPRAAFTAQISGTLLGAILNFVVMNSIIDNQREILLSVEGTNIWSGQQPQLFNSQAIAWGGLSKELFSVGSRYQWVPWAYVIGFAVPVPFWIIHRYWPKLRLDYLSTPIICYFAGSLGAGINSSVGSFYLIGFLSQYLARKKYPGWFKKYNYIASAALDGGTQVMVFILSFAVDGAAGTAHLIPEWWGANRNGNYDRCLFLNG